MKTKTVKIDDPFFQEPNASRLRRAIADMNAGRNIVEHDLIGGPPLPVTLDCDKISAQGTKGNVHV